MTDNPWTAPGLTPEERARAVLTGVYDMRWPDEDYAKVTAAIRAAVAEETERCGRVAEGYYREPAPMEFNSYLDGSNDAAETIANAIRVPTSGAAAGGES